MMYEIRSWCPALFSLSHCSALVSKSPSDDVKIKRFEGREPGENSAKIFHGVENNQKKVFESIRGIERGNEEIPEAEVEEKPLVKDLEKKKSNIMKKSTRLRTLREK